VHSNTTYASGSLSMLTRGSIHWKWTRWSVRLKGSALMDSWMLLGSSRLSTCASSTSEQYHQGKLVLRIERPCRYNPDTYKKHSEDPGFRENASNMFFLLSGAVHMYGISAMHHSSSWFLVGFVMLCAHASGVKTREWADQVNMMLSPGPLKRQLYSSYTLIWDSCLTTEPVLKNGGDVYATPHCLWGNMLPHKIFFLLALMKTNNVTALVESGRKGGMSAFTYSKFIPVVASVEYHVIPSVQYTLQTVAPNIRIFNGDGGVIVPNLVNSLAASGERVAVILDGPKGMKAVDVATRIIEKCVFIALDDTSISSPHGQLVERLFGINNLISSMEPSYLSAHIGDDRKWAIEMLRKPIRGQLRRTLLSATSSCFFASEHNTPNRSCSRVVKAATLAVKGGV